ncbi:MAG: glutamate-1-semialdehyde 2,1-aminomutase [Bacteroidia bacterium]|nr:glutamate-1-semialdehyde 2,1-aminomutase [Bacteroidia bacterium]
MNHTKSKSLFSAAVNLFPGGVNSPVRAFRSVGGTPLFISKGKGSRIWDADGNEYLDFCGSWGPLIHGHAPEFVTKAAVKALRAGSSFGAPTALENELARLIITHHRGIEKMRFVSSGTEAVMSAIRMARGYTGRTKLLKFEGCYHGHSDSLLVKAGSGLVTHGNSSSAGVPDAIAENTLVCHLDDEAGVEKAFKEHPNSIACVIIEPVPANNGLLLQRKEFLSFLRKKCSAEGALLIFDEVISGFRLGFEGAYGYYKVKPDIFTFGKIIGGGFPVGAYASSARIMSMIAPEGKVYQAGTLSGNPVAMSAGIAQLKACLRKGFYQKLEKKTKDFVKAVHSGTKDVPGFRIWHLGSIFWFTFTDKKQIRRADEVDHESMKRFSTLYHYLLEHGIYLGPSGYEVGFISAAHTASELKHAAAVFVQGVRKIAG